MQLTLPLPDLAEIDGPPPSVAQRIYCNRSLRLDEIDWIGFDMDYTLAVYRQAEMDRLSIEATEGKLVEQGYTEALLGMSFRTDFPIRGLLVDRKLGNVLKMDRYKYVKRAYHGMRELTKEERRRHYHTRRLRPASARYHWVDTLYALPEVSVFAAAVETIEATTGSCDFEKLFNDVRHCIDLSHQDGSILDHIVADLPRYVNRDPELGRTLHHLRSSGKRLFLLTNSQPGYTEKMMTYLLGGASAEYRDWRSYFDLVISNARKPSFFTGDAAFQEVLADGTRGPASGPLERGRDYARGNIHTLQAQLGVSPDRVLYVGDHIYGDVLRARKETAWRTVMVIQEMNDELGAHAELEHSLARLDALSEMRARLVDDLRAHQRVVKRLQRRRDEHGLSATEEAERARRRRASDLLRHRLRALDSEYDSLEAGVAHRYHPFWGSLFKAGSEVSSFGHQVETYAGLYTSRVSNFLYYSPMHYFQSPRDRMPHEL